MARKRFRPSEDPLDLTPPQDDLVVNGKPKRRSPRERNRVATAEVRQLALAREASGEAASPPAPSPLLKEITAAAHYVPYDPALSNTAGDYPHKGRAGRPPAESSQAAYAFALYCALPPGERSYQAVLDILVKEGRNSINSLPLVARWGARWNWNERAKLHDAQIIEERRKQWEIERIGMHQEIAASSAAVYHEVVKLLEQRARDGRLGNDAAVQLLRVAADLRHRSYNELVAQREETKTRGIEITIETRTDTDEARKRFASANPQVIELSIPLRDPDEADMPITVGGLDDPMAAAHLSNQQRRARRLMPHIVEGEVVERSEDDEGEGDGEGDEDE